MPSPVEMLRAEHQALAPKVAFIRAAADVVGQASGEEVREDVDEVLGFLTHDLVPHAELEERSLYRVIAQASGSPDLTATMSRDHLEIRRLAERLQELRPRLRRDIVAPADLRETRRVLYGLFAIVSLHLAKEEEIYLPFLEARLTPAELEALAREMSDAGTVAVSS